jgi:hypothetical protein
MNCTVRALAVVTVTSALTGWYLHGASCLAYPAFQEYVEKHSGRMVNCSMCHANGSGPQGDGPGQLGKLDAEQMKRVNQARTAMQPGVNVNSPILNKFGNEIIFKIGLQKFLQTMAKPETLPEALGRDSDLDGDGICDAQEYLDGTDPLDKFHGDPAKLFFINLGRNKEDLELATLATVLISFGLMQFLKGFRALSPLPGGKLEEEASEAPGEKPGETPGSSAKP